MTDKHLSEAELTSFADSDLPPEQLRRIEKHLEGCSACAKQVMALGDLTADIAAELPQPGWDVAAHTAAVMKRLDAPLQKSAAARWLPWAGVLAAAAAVGLIASLRGHAPEPPALAARGGDRAASLSRDVGVQLYAQEEALRPLGAGSVIGVDTALTAGLRNLGSERAHLLLFAVDARQVVHWIAPEFTAPGSDPEAATIAAVSGERLLPSAAAFDDLAPGPLRVVAVITAKPTRVSEVEGLSAAQLSDSGLSSRFPAAEIRQLSLQVSPQAKP